MLQDFRFALRLFRAHAAAAATAVLILSLGIGATTTVFSLFDALFLRPLNAPEPEALVRLQLVTRDGRTQTSFSYPLFSDFRDQARTFSAIAGYVEGPATIRIGDYADRAAIEFVTSEYFALLGAPPAIGRAFSRADETAREAVVVLSHDFWARTFNRDPAAVGATVYLNGRPFTVIGVAREGFTGARQAVAPRLWAPAPLFLSFVGMPDLADQRGVGFLGVIARLAGGVSPAAAADEGTAIGQRVEENFGESRIATIGAARGDDGPVDAFRGAARLVGAAALLLLVMACVNVMHILLAWGEGRRREVAMRLALGGSRRRVVRQFFVESLTLSAFGMAAGVLLATWALALLARAPVLQTAGVHLDARLDARVLAMSAAAAVVAALVAGLLPAWRAARQPLTQGIRREAAAPGRWRAGSVMAVAQVSVSLLLLMTAGLFTRSLSQLKATDTNLAADRVLALQAQFGMEATPDYLSAAADRTIEALTSLPGVVSAAAATTLPVSESGMQQRFDAGTTQPAFDADMQVELQFISPEYFSTIGLPLVAGRVFSPGDEDANPIVVNESFARHYWPGADAVGRTFTNQDEPFQVVGVAHDTKYRSLSEAGAMVMYRPLRQFPARTLSLVIRTDGPPSRLASAVRQRLQETEPGVTLLNVRTLEEHIGRSLELDRARAAALALFAGLALLLVSLGVYGIMAYSVSRRLREMGIRLALGASPQSVAALVLRRAAVLVGAGILLGALGVSAGGQLLAAELHGVTPTDPATLAASAVLLLAIALIASYLPARRASRVDPMAVLHLE